MSDYTDSLTDVSSDSFWEVKYIQARNFTVVHLQLTLQLLSSLYL